MKLAGKTESRVAQVLVLPRHDGDLVFKAGPVKSYEDFTKMVPQPEPPQVLVAGGKTITNTDDPDYNSSMMKWAELQTHYMIIESLKQTPDLEWETVEADMPNTWGNYAEELRSFGLVETEIVRLINLVKAANGLDDDLITEARDRYFRDINKPGKLEESAV